MGAPYIYEISRLKANNLNSFLKVISAGVQQEVWVLGHNVTARYKCHLHKVTYTRCRIYTINSPDDGHMAAQNM